MIVLATESPFKIKQFQTLNIDFTTYSPKLDENSIQFGSDLSFEIKAIELAIAKAKVAKKIYPAAIIVAGDQIAANDEKLLVKPGNPECNIRQLLLLSGQTHRLYTANAILYPNGEIKSHLEVAVMKMHPLSELEARKYVEEDEPWMCVGGYKYETTAGAKLFKSVEVNDKESIQGMCINFLIQKLRI